MNSVKSHNERDRSLIASTATLAHLTGLSDAIEAAKTTSAEDVTFGNGPDILAVTLGQDRHQELDCDGP